MDVVAAPDGNLARSFAADMDRIDGAGDRQTLIDAAAAAVAPFGFTDIVIARMERREGFLETAEIVATFPEFLDYLDLGLKLADPAVVVGQSLTHPVVVPFDLSLWRGLTEAQASALAGPLAARIGTRLYLPGAWVSTTTFYGICFSGGGPEAGQGMGEPAPLWTVARATAARLAALDGLDVDRPDAVVPLARLLTPEPIAPVSPADSGLIARQARLLDVERPPALSVIRPRR